MAWNEPGSRKSDPNDSRKPEVPPDLDEVLRQLHKKLRGFFGHKKPGVTPGNATPSSTSQLNFNAIFTFIGLVILLLWFLAGFFIVDPPEKAAVLRFGKYIKTVEPGLHWVPPFIDNKYVVNVQQVLTFPYQAEMLTQDENIVSVDLVVQYRINDLQAYLFNVANPNESLQQATASALRQVIGQTPLDNVLTSGREVVRQQTTRVLENTLTRYHTGLLIMDVNMQPAKPPEEVTDAFDDAIKAREDEQRFKNQAVTYANRIVPIAQGDAARLKAEAEAYQQQVVLNAQGATAQYLALLPEYQRAPEVTRERMYMDTLQTVLANTSKIILDAPQANNVMYLPLDRLINKSTAKSVAAPEPLKKGSADSAPATKNVSTIPGMPGNNTAGQAVSGGRPGYDTTASDSNNVTQGG